MGSIAVWANSLGKNLNPHAQIYTERGGGGGTGMGRREGVDSEDSDYEDEESDDEDDYQDDSRAITGATALDMTTSATEVTGNLNSRSGDAVYAFQYNNENSLTPPATASIKASSSRMNVSGSSGQQRRKMSLTTDDL